MTYLYNVHRKDESSFRVVRVDNYTHDDYTADNELEIGTYGDHSCARMLVDALYSAQRLGNVGNI